MPTGVEVGNGARVAATSKVFTQGQVTQTGQQFDLAIQGDGFFEVQQQDGTIAYTRDGSFKLNAQGQVVTADGLPVLSGFQAVPAGTTAIDISPTGNVTMTGTGGTEHLPGDARPLRQSRPACRAWAATFTPRLRRAARPRPASPTRTASASILQGYLEGSNVNIVEEMVNLITAQRAYEINSKSVQASDQMLQNVAQMKQ